MITQRLVQDLNTNAGTLTITCEPGNLAELLGIYEELKLRMNVTTEGTITTNPAPEQPTQIS